MEQHQLWGDGPIDSRLHLAWEGLAKLKKSKITLQNGEPENFNLFLLGEIWRFWYVEKRRNGKESGKRRKGDIEGKGTG